MIAPIHALVGAGVARAAKNKWWLALPIAFWSHQVIDFANPYVQHYLPNGIDLWLGIPGLIIVLAIAWLPWRGWWPPRWWFWSALAATGPDIIDWGILRLLGQSPAIHRFFWSSLWLDPWWAVVWLVAAIGLGVALLVPYREKLITAVTVIGMIALIVFGLRRRKKDDGT